MRRRVRDEPHTVPVQHTALFHGLRIEVATLESRLMGAMSLYRVALAQIAAQRTEIRGLREQLAHMRGIEG